MSPLPWLPLLLCVSSIPCPQDPAPEDSRLEALVGEYEVRARL